LVRDQTTVADCVTGDVMGTTTLCGEALVFNGGTNATAFVVVGSDFIAFLLVGADARNADRSRGRPA
jgi:hypothetical protein